MMTPDVWKERVEHAMHGHLTKCYDMKSVEFCCGCPDYTSQFIDEYFDTTQIMGLARVQEVRFAMHPTEDHVAFHYKTHALSQGWLPRRVIPAAEGFFCEHWRDVPEFQHPDPGQGCPVGVKAVSMEHVRGMRQYWQYIVKYAMGGEKEIRLRSNGVPLGITPAAARKILENGFIRQPVSQERISDLAVARACVLLYTKKFGSPEDVTSWTKFFDDNVPEEPLNRTNCVPNRDSYLDRLFRDYGGPPRRKSREHLNLRPTISDFSEAMVFPEAPWSRAERDAAAQYAVSTENRLMYNKADLKRVVTRKKKNVTIESASKLDTIASGSQKKSRKKMKKRRKLVDLDDISASSHSTEASKLCMSMKSGDNSDIESGLSFDFSRDAGDDDTSIATDFSTTDVDILPKNMKHKDVAETYFAKIGKRFKDLDENIIYRIISVCRYDQNIVEAGRPLVHQLCFRYIYDDLQVDDVENSDDIERSFCSEMMAEDCNWVEWL